MAEEQSLETFCEEPGPEEQLLSRRQFLGGAVAGGAAGLAVAAGTGVTVWKITDAETQAVRADAEAQIARLQGLVGLYEDLEKVGLDSILQTAMVAVTLPLEAVELGAKALKGGLDLAREALLSLEEGLPSVHESIRWLEARVSALAASIEKLETAVGKALDRATDNPVAQTLKDFADMVLNSLPFGIGDKIRDVLEELVNLVSSVDELLEGINTVLLEPIRDRWFSEEEGQGLGSILVDPLIEHLLDPLGAHLEDLAELTDTWQHQLVAPSQQALETRAGIRQSIARYRKDHGFG